MTFTLGPRISSVNMSHFMEFGTKQPLKLNPSDTNVLGQTFTQYFENTETI